MARSDSRANDALRSVEIIPGFHRPSEGSVLYKAQGTIVLCTVSIEDKVPVFLEGKGQGWLTAEYLMHPRANPRRQERDGRGKAPSGRTQEIQRLIGRSLRAAVLMDKIGERTITIDCDVLEADGGTRTASITGGFVALALAVKKIGFSTRVLRDSVAAVSVGILKDDSAVLDLPYVEDSTAEVDLNLVATGKGHIIEVQGTAEGAPVPRARIDQLVDLGLKGIADLTKIQRDVLSRAGVDLNALLA
jgi:ribonuclease PH